MSKLFARSISLDGAANASALLALYEVTPRELEQVRSFGRLVLPRLEEYVRLFYDWLKPQPEFDQFFSSAEKLAHVQKQQADYWRDFFQAQVNEEYLEKRRHVGDRHARIGLSLHAYFAAVSKSLDLFVDHLYDGSLTDDVYAATVRALTRLVHLDTTVVVEAYSRRIHNLLSDQHRSLMEMSTPVTAIWKDILMLPVVGIIDSRRAQDIMHAMLTKIAQTQSRVFILDISGVGVVDTAVANHLIKITKATRLMGCQCTVSGVSPAIAETIVELGIDVGDMRTTATLRDALQQAFREIGVELRQARG